MPQKTKKTPSSPTKSGSTSTSDLKEDFVDVAGVPQFQKRKGPGKGGRALTERNPALKELSARKALVGELTVAPGADPVTVAEDHLKTLAPTWAKEIEYTSKFGSDAARYQAAKDGLAMVGITTKPKDAYTPPVSMTFNVGDLPVTAKGVPVLPFSNAAKRLDAPKAPVTIDVTPDVKKAP